ncbi:hypothetical protein GALMADRAFT_79204 [Galerina marginata CBS 339.88]|uniref:CHAT domain-containing protein n=1 Tax=Galerina marginata (strain CBS 339.88) TaxID=685588 RepID=A0A067SMP2_GALM3|nr:hypothetical protein GALMADRAFT_79204 [Galerina marginata CBS 339.88]
MSNLDETIRTRREILNLCPPGHPKRSRSLQKLADDLHNRFEELGRIEDLEDVISSHREALTLCPPGHPNRFYSLIDLGIALDSRFDQLGQIEDLENSVSFQREALTLCPPGHPNRSNPLVNLANALRTRFDRLGQIEDLEDAISSHREALTLRPPGHPNRSNPLINLANVLQTQFGQLGRMEDLEDAISCLREALTLRPPGHPNRSYSLNNLGTGLRARFDQLGGIEDLEDAISSLREALTLSLTLRPPGHPNRSQSLINFGIALHARFDQLGRIEDLEDAISSLREALTLRPPGHPDRSDSLINLGNALRTRFDQLGQIEDLEDAIPSHREALTLCPPDHPNRSGSLFNLGNALRTRFNHLGGIEDLEDAISSLRESLKLCPPGHVNHPILLENLAYALQTRFSQLRQMEDLDESFALYVQAGDLTSAPWYQLRAALNWAATSRHYHHKSLLSAYIVSFRLLDRCFISRPTVQLQHKFLAGAEIPKSLASDAASAAIDAIELTVAVELLEQGRAILWSKIEGYRHPLDQLRHVDSELADHVENLSRQLEHLVLSSNSGSLDSDGPVFSASLDAQFRNHRILSEDWEKVVERVRQVEGFHNFLQTVPFATLQTAAAEGPVILVNISEYRSDAIIIRTENPPVLVALPDVHPKDLNQLIEQLDFARNVSLHANSSKEFIPILRKMWNDIVSPVVNCLTKLGVPEKSRIWWCPTSELCSLPLHAAGPYRADEKNLPDIYISSYIPTLSALIRARSNPIPQAVAPKLVVVGQPGEDLPSIQEEIGIIQQLGDSVDVITGPRANRKTVLRVLQHHSWAHFACHGHLGDEDKPFLASFQLHGGSRLTLLDLMGARLPNAELAFLSACHSVGSDLVTPNETIHLAAALQFCGFRSVVGTLWEMNDEDGPNISKEFYRHMFRNGGKKADFRDAAEALSLAIREMRKNGVPLYRWIMFVHIGA